MTKMNYDRPIYRVGKEAKVDESTKPVEMRVYLMASFRDKDKVKMLGAKWDPSLELWFTYPSHPNINKMRQWIHEDDYERCGIKPIELPLPKNNLERLLRTLKTK